MSQTYTTKDFAPIQFDDCTWGRFSRRWFAKRFNADRPLEEVRRDLAGRALATEQLSDWCTTKKILAEHWRLPW